ncbi:heat shock protein 30 [Niveomyces insectorum RCEF 264]|uniref:Heat shock protein 30 n=1 Tax=Niveomyces insectorum RCEF 264 TaxID=1081102 RepID=A0A167ZRZ9_9HYPO|nr:heat shock protein 30 [Niveomyces insectorum RCEF 264]
MAAIHIRSNDALNINPPSGDEHLVVHGSDWLWAVTAIFIVSFLAVVAWTFFARAGEKVFHYIYTIGLLVGAVAYYAMASDLGYSVVTQADQVGNGLTRQIFFAKYCFWVVEFPSVVLSLGLLSGVSWATIVYHIFLSWFWVVNYLLSAFTATNYKWGFFALGTVGYLLLAWGTLGSVALSSVRRFGVAGVTRDYLLLAGWTNLLWLLYPIAFGVGDGGNKIGVTESFIFYGILDVLLLPVVAFATLLLARRWDYNQLNLVFTQYGRVPVANGAFPEKAAPANNTPLASATPADNTPAVPEGVVTA